MTLNLYDPVSIPFHIHSRCTELRSFPSQKSFHIVPSHLLMAIRLCLDESTADLGTTLAGRETDLGVGGALLDLLIGLGEDELDVAGVGHVGVDLSRKISMSFAKQ